MSVEKNARTTKIRELNDRFRNHLTSSVLGKVVITSGVQDQFSSEELYILICMVRNYDTFNEENDPYGEHDFGSFTIKGEQVYWKIDYYDKAYQCGSVDPSVPSLTKRVLTILLASEY